MIHHWGQWKTGIPQVLSLRRGSPESVLTSVMASSVARIYLNHECHWESQVVMGMMGSVLRYRVWMGWCRSVDVSKVDVLSLEG